MGLVVRAATEHDAESVAWIYNAGIEARTATFETRPRTESDMLSWIAGPLPFVVAEQDGRVVGWAALTPYDIRTAYAGVAEFSAYLDPEVHGRGIGRALLAELLREAEAAGLHKVIGRIFASNASSLKVCSSLGFEQVGVHRRHAKLDGEWRDVVVTERLLGEAAQR